MYLCQAVPGPGQYEIKSQFEKTGAMEEEDEDDLVEGGTRKVPFGSRLQVCVWGCVGCWRDCV